MRILFVCTANVDRSPAAEIAFKAIAGDAHESRSAGTSATAHRPLRAADLEWADIVAVMEDAHRHEIERRWPDQGPKIRVLDVPDCFHRDDPALRRALESRLTGLLAGRGGMIGP